ncbi:50S ribosomal protein L3 [bacterium]|nr:50S ribosomal protein L3 [bacterium]
MNKILGKKVGMTQIFLEEGKSVPVTVVKSGKMKVTQIKSNENDGYNAIQVGLVEEVKRIRHKKPILHHLKKAEATDIKYMKEERVDDVKSYKLGDTIELSSLLSEGDFVNVTGKSIGRGFAGTTKKFGFHGGRKTHGSRFHRAPGSIGMCRPTRTIKGRKMPGHLGNEQVTIKNLKILKIDKDKNLILIMGGVPGPKNGNLEIRKVK